MYEITIKYDCQSDIQCFRTITFSAHDKGLRRSLYRTENEIRRTPGEMTLAKEFYFSKVIFHVDGIPPPPLLVELLRVDANEGDGAPDSAVGGGGLGSSMPISLPTTSNVLNIFLRALSTAMPCPSSACVHQHQSFRDEPSKFSVYLCSLREHSRAATSFSTVLSKSSSTFFAPPLPLFPADDDLLLRWR